MMPGAIIVLANTYVPLDRTGGDHQTPLGAHLPTAPGFRPWERIVRDFADVAPGSLRATKAAT